MAAVTVGKPFLSYTLHKLYVYITFVSSLGSSSLFFLLAGAKLNYVTRHNSIKLKPRSTNIYSKRGLQLLSEKTHTVKWTRFIANSICFLRHKYLFLIMQFLTKNSKLCFTVVVYDSLILKLPQYYWLN